MRKLIPIALAGCMALAATPSPAEDKSFACKPVPTPVVALAFGSRYTDDSKTRSDLDEASNAEVDKALKPVESFIGELSKMANAAFLDENQRPERAGCVLDWLTAWADAQALTGLDTVNAKLAIPARHAGLALALLQVEAVADLDPEKRAKVDAWLLTLGGEMTAFFDTEAPTNASRNNLRAWAGLAAVAIGRVTADDALLGWGRSSFELVACQASADGSLPLEMGRADRALNYQLHAVAPLVVTADLLAASGYDGYAACGGKLDSIVAFSLAAIEDPTLVEAINGKEQTFSSGKQELEPFMMAWAEPQLRHRPSPELEAFVAPLRPLSHSKLGGNLTKLGDWVAGLAPPAT